MFIFKSYLQIGMLYFVHGIIHTSKMSFEIIIAVVNYHLLFTYFNIGMYSLSLQSIEEFTEYINISTYVQGRITFKARILCTFEKIDWKHQTFFTGIICIFITSTAFTNVVFANISVWLSTIGPHVTTSSVIWNNLNKLMVWFWHKQTEQNTF